MTGSRGTVLCPSPPVPNDAPLGASVGEEGASALTESPAPMGSIERSTRAGLQTTITDNVELGQFEVAVEGRVIGHQPYRRYRANIVLMATQVDTQWRDRGVSSAMINGVLSLIRAAGHMVIPRCKLTGDYILRHPEYRDLVPSQYQGLLHLVSRPTGPAVRDNF
jgi:predicted GNAT family acetyltransferase